MQNSNGKATINKPFMTRLQIGDDRPIPDITGTMIALRNAGLLQSRSAFFSQLIDSDGNGKDLPAEDDEDIRKILGPNVSSAFKPTYAFEELIRYHEAWREDGIASMAIEVLAQAIVGDHFKTVIDINDEFEDDEIKKAALEKLKADPKIQSFKREIDIVNKEVKATEALKALIIQGMVFGSSASIIEKDPDTNLPIAIKILPSMSLGRRFVDKSTWRLIGLEYLDYKFPQSIIKTEDIFYLAFRNYHMSPNTMHYGYSLFEKIISLSETNRVINQRNLPETNFRLWSPMLLIKMPNNVNQSVMNQMQQDVANGAGNAIVTNQQVQIEPVTLNVSLQEMTTERNQNNLEIVRQLQMPELLYNPDVMNRATSQELMESWNVFVLNPYQTWIADTIQEQWIDPMIKQLIENDRAGIIDEPGEGIIPPEELAQIQQQQDQQKQQQQQTSLARQQSPFQPNQQSSNDSNPNQQKKPQQPQPSGQPKPNIPKPMPVTPLNEAALFGNAIDPKTGEIKVSRLNWKIKVVFDPVNLDTFLDKVKAYMILFNNATGPIGGERVLKGVGLEEDIPGYQQRQEEKQAFQEQQFGLRSKIVDLRQQQLDTNPTPNAGGGPNTGFNAGDVTKNLNSDLKVSAKAASLQSQLDEELEYQKHIQSIPTVEFTSKYRRIKDREKQAEQDNKSIMEILLPKLQKKLEEI